MDPKKINKTIEFFKDYYELFNHLLIMASRYCNKDTFKKMKNDINTINPLLFDKRVMEIYEINDPWKAITNKIKNKISKNLKNMRMI